jgi:hypothetical protein
LRSASVCLADSRRFIAMKIWYHAGTIFIQYNCPLGPKLGIFTTHSYLHIGVFTSKIRKLAALFAVALFAGILSPSVSGATTTVNLTLDCSVNSGQQNQYITGGEIVIYTIKTRIAPALETAGLVELHTPSTMVQL